MTINYNPNTPTPDLSYADWQVQFKQNFQQLYNAFEQNHVPLDDATTANRGNHTFIQMPEQTTETQTGSQEIAMYAKDVTEQADQVFLTYPGNTPVVQFTNYQLYTIPASFNQTFYFTFLPGKLLVYFGSFGPFANNVGFNELFLKPAIAKNIVSINLCLKGTTPNYTPEVTIVTPAQAAQYFGDKSGFIKYINIVPVSPQRSRDTVFYLVVANI